MSLTPDETRALIRHFYDEAWNKNNLAVYDEVVHDDFIDHRPSPGLPPGREGFKQLNVILHSAFPDMQVTIDDAIVEGDKVSARWTSKGTHTGDLWGIPPTGRKVDFTATVTYRLQDGKLIEGWINRDDLELMRQLGVIPSP